MQELVGKIVEKIFINGDQSVLAFKIDDGTIIAYETEGDCCSTTWFADIVGAHELTLVPATNLELKRITNVTMSDMSWYKVNDGRCRQDKDIAYGYTITTNWGSCAIAFRNSSNGYYGGSIRLIDLKDLNGFVEIVDDTWSA